MTSKRDNLLTFHAERLKLDTLVFLVTEQKVYYTIPLFSDTLGQLNIWGIMEKRAIFLKALIIISRINKN